MLNGTFHMFLILLVTCVFTVLLFPFTVRIHFFCYSERTFLLLRPLQQTCNITLKSIARNKKFD